MGMITALSYIFLYAVLMNSMSSNHPLILILIHLFSGSSSVAAPNSTSSFAAPRNVASILGSSSKSSNSNSGDNKMNNDDSNRKISNDNR